MILLRPVTPENFVQVLSLKVKEGQESYLSGNMESLAEAFIYLNSGQVAAPFAIYDFDTLIGFVMLGYGSNGAPDEPEIAVDNYLLWRLMFDEKYQGKGYFKPVLDTVVEYVKTWPYGKASYMWVAYEPDNERAKALYHKYGFVDTGDVCDDGEIVAKIKL